MMQKLDCFLMGRFRAFSVWFEKRTGKNNFFLSRIAALATVKTMIAVALYGASDAHWRIFGMEVIKIKAGYAWSIPIAALLVYAFWLCGYSEKCFKENPAGWLPTMFRSAPMPGLRVVIFSAAALETLLLPSSLMCLLTTWTLTACIYFASAMPFAPETENASSPE